MKILSIILILITTYVSANEPPVIVFDFGGVIAQADTVKMGNFLLDTFDIEPEELSIAFRKMLEQGGSEEEFWREFAATKSIELQDDWMDQFGVVIAESITEIPGTLEIAQELRSQGYQIAILSDMTQYQAEVIRKAGYFDLFDPVLLSHENRVKKPQPEAFQILLKRLDKPASSVIFTDDRIENVEAAQLQGIDAIHFITPEQFKKDLESKGIDPLLWYR